MFTLENGFGIPLPHLFHIDKRIRLSDLTRRYYRNIIYKLLFTELFDTDR